MKEGLFMEKFRFETVQLHAGKETLDAATGARAVPIGATASYVFENSAQAAQKYNRKNNRKTDRFMV